MQIATSDEGIYWQKLKARKDDCSLTATIFYSRWPQRGYSQKYLTHCVLGAWFKYLAEFG